MPILNLSHPFFLLHLYSIHCIYNPELLTGSLGRNSLKPLMHTFLCFLYHFTAILLYHASSMCEPKISMLKITFYFYCCTTFHGRGPLWRRLNPRHCYPYAGEDCGYWTVGNTVKGDHPVFVWGERLSCACVSELQLIEGNHCILGTLSEVPHLYV